MKLLASDFDGTLFFENTPEKYRQDDIKAIQKFQALGNKFGVCTGRPLIGVTDFALDSFSFDFYIVNSGAIVLNHDFKVICKHRIEFQTVKQVIEHYPDLMMLIATVDQLYMVNSKKQFDNDLIKNLQTVEQLQEQTILSFSLLLHNDQEVLQVKEFLNQFDDIEVYQNITAIDVAAKNCSKKNGIEAIANYYRLEKKDLACIGDSYNDVSMLEYLDNSYTFDYSPIEVQEIAKHIVSHLDECIEHLLNNE